MYKVRTLIYPFFPDNSKAYNVQSKNRYSDTMTLTNLSVFSGYFNNVFKNVFSVYTLATPTTFSHLHQMGSISSLK